MDEEIGPERHQGERNEIGADDLQEEVGGAHIAGANAETADRRVMHGVPEATHHIGSMQYKAMRNVLYNVMPNCHSRDAGDKDGERNRRRANEGEPRPLHEKHRRQQDESLIGEHARQELEIADALHALDLEALERAAAIEPLEPEPNAMIGEHLNEPDLRRERRPGDERIQHYLSP